MARNEKIIRLGKAIEDSLVLQGLDVVVSYDASNDLYMTIADSGPAPVNAIVKLDKIAQLGNNQTNPVTGIANDVYTPHVIKLGFGALAAANGTYTIGDDLIAGDKATIDSNDFAAVDSGAVGDEWNIIGTKATGSATLLSGLTAGDAVAAANVLTINTHGFTAKNSGAAGDEFDIVGTPAVGTVQVGADLIAGDKVTIDGHDFVSIDSGAAGDEFNITGTYGGGTVELLAALTAGDALVATNDVIVGGVAFTAKNSGAGANEFNLVGTPASEDLTVGANLTAGDTAIINGVTVTAVDSGAVGDEFDIVGVPAASTVQCAGVVDTNTVLLGGVTLTATVATQDATNFIVGISDTETATNLCTTIAANPTLSALVTADNVGGTSATVTITFKAKGTSGNTFGTVDGGSGHFVCANATLINGAVTVNDCATNLAAAIVASVTAGLVGVITAIPVAAVVTVESIALGTLRNGTTLVGTGDITATSGTLTGGALDLTLSAVELANAIVASVSPAIAGIITATPALAVVTLDGINKGTSGNLTLAQTGVGFTLSGVAMTGGAITVITTAAALAAAITGSVTAGISGVWTASNGGTDTATVTSVALGTLRNGTTLVGTGDLSVSGATITGGTIDLALTADNIAAAIVASVTVGIVDIVTATSALGVVGLEGVWKGTSGNVSVTQTGAGFTLVSLAGGAVNKTLCAAALAAAITNSITVGIDGVVDATSALAVVTVTADVPGSGGNTISTTGSGDVIAGAGTLAGGSDTGTTPALAFRVFGASILRGTQVNVYNIAGAFGVADLVDANLSLVFRDEMWGNLTST